MSNQVQDELKVDSTINQNSIETLTELGPIEVSKDPEVTKVPNEVFDEAGITITSTEESGITIMSDVFGNKKTEVGKHCQQCKVKEWIYTCPRCLIRTCSVICVKKHKKETTCTGERDKTAYVPLKQYNESNMMSGNIYNSFATDHYTYLEDVSRQSDNITRSRLNVDKDLKVKSAENRMKLFSKTVNQMGIYFSSLPYGMSRNKLNQSNYSKNMKQVFWSIEINFCKNNKRQRYLEHSFPSNKTLYAFFENLLLSENPQGKGSFNTMRHELREFIEAGLDNFVIGLKKEKSKKGHFVNLTECLRSLFKDALKGETIIEYPILYIWLKDDERPNDIVQLDEKKQLIKVIQEPKEVSNEETTTDVNNKCEDEDMIEEDNKSIIDDESSWSC